MVPVVVGLWTVNWWYVWSRNLDGQFGDMFGAVNALFSGLAFAALIYTIQQQRSELRLTQVEFEATTDELAAQSSHLEGQRKLLELQAFEHTLFQLLQLHHEIVASMADENRSGRGVIAEFANVLRNKIRQVITSSRASTVSELTPAFGHEAGALAQGFGRGYMPIYLSHLTEMLRFVAGSGLPETGQQIYGRFISAQLGLDEKTVVHYCALSNEWAELRDLAGRYGLFRHLPDVSLVQPAHRHLYPTTAYE